jgi:cytochrome c7-like protein
MRVVTMFSVFVVALLLVTGAHGIGAGGTVQDVKKPPEVITLAAEAKLGPVKFNHLEHITKNHSPDGTKQIECVACHHTAQPAAEAVKHPPHKTVWPADRTTTLTVELAEKDPNAVGAVCHDCHTKTDAKPKLLDALPQIKTEGGEALVLNNQQAFHRSCGGCHDEAMKARPSLSPAPPTSKKCTGCHKKTAA